MGERILGIDLTDQGAGVMFSDSEQSFHVPAAICRDKKNDFWYVGEEAYEKALSGKGILTDRLVSLSLKGGTATIRGVRYEGAELLGRFLGMVREGCLRASGGEAPSCTVLVLPLYDRAWMERILEVLPEYGFDSGSISCITRQESFLYYVMNQPREIRTAEVGLFDLNDNALSFYEFQMRRDKRKLFVRVDQEDLKEAFALSVLATPNGEKLADKIMSSAAERLLRRKVFSSVFLTGKGFEEYSWAQHFMKLVCQRRKVYLDGELFIKGAVIRGSGLLSGKGDPGFTALCSGRSAASVTMKVERNGQPLEFPVLNAGDPVFSSDMELRLLPGSGENLEFLIEPVATRKKKLVRVPAPVLPEREEKTSFIDVSLCFPDEDRMLVRLKDAGFGELFPPGGASSETEISFSSQETGVSGGSPLRAVLCSSTEPEKGLRIEELGVRICSAEELCYCITKHPLLFMDGFAGEPMLRFLEDGAGERLLAAELRQLKENRVRDDDLLLKLLELSGYLTGPELGEFRGKLLSFRQLSAPEYLKEKADEMFRLRRFGKAVAIYDRILAGEEEKALSLRLKGTVLVRKGSACANLFLFEKAFRAYSEAWDLLHEQEILKKIWFLSLLEPVIGTRERYQEAVMKLAAQDDSLAASPGDVSADPADAADIDAAVSLPLEEWEAEYEEARQHAAQGPGRQKIAEVFEGDPVQRMKKAAVTVSRWKQDYRTML
ncbi:MAG: hypothetical protein IJT43_04475 [Stomatobaculum sp.]|nr:hypothetical protein [Stomatobaculum sp.]